MGERGKKKCSFLPFYFSLYFITFSTVGIRHLCLPTPSLESEGMAQCPALAPEELAVVGETDTETPHHKTEHLFWLVQTLCWVLPVQNTPRVPVPALRSPRCWVLRELFPGAHY